MLQKKTMEEMEAMRGKDHLDALCSRSELAACYRDAGQLNEAMKLDEMTLEARNLVLGEDHPDSISICKTLTEEYQAAGRNEDFKRLEADKLL